MSINTNEQEMNNQYAESEEMFHKANIIVAGASGVGKSTLINTVFGTDLAATGIGSPVTQEITMYEHGNIPVRIWDVPGWELDNGKNARTFDAIKKVIAERSKLPDHTDTIHAIWYCVGAPGRRYQKFEADFNRKLYAFGIPFFIVMTQCYIPKKQVKVFEDLINDFNRKDGMDGVKVIPVLAQPFEIEVVDDQTFTKAAFGVDELVRSTTTELPNFIKNGFIAAQQVDKQLKRDACGEVIDEYVKKAQRGGWQNWPFINIITADLSIRDMFRKLCDLHRGGLLPDSAIDKIRKEMGHIDPKYAFQGQGNSIYFFLKKVKNRH